MTNLQKLLKFLSEPDYAIKFRTAGNYNACIMCKKDANEFSNESAKLEYKCSRLCEKCQKKYIHGAIENFMPEKSFIA